MRAFRPGLSGGSALYAIRLANALAELEEIAVGYSDEAAPCIEPYLSEKVARYRLNGGNRRSLAAGEQALLNRIEPEWCVYSYPGVFDGHAPGVRCRTATIVYDLQHLDTPGNFSPAERWNRDRALGTACHDADRVFCVSRFTAAELEREFPSVTGKTRVLHGGVAEVDGMFQGTPNPVRWLLYPANFWPHKNHHALLDAYQILRLADPALKLVLTGGRAESADPSLRRRFSEPGVDVRGYVSEDKLQHLLRGAACLVFPSLHEGLGMPVLEALAAGIPVACSRRASLPEVGGDVAEYFEPDDRDDIARAVRSAIARSHDPLWRERAAKHASSFRFQNAAEILSHVLKDCPFEKQLPEEGDLWKSFPSADAILLPAGVKTVTRRSLAEGRALSVLETIRINPNTMGSLLERSELQLRNSSALSFVDYARLLRLVASGRLVIGAVPGGAASSQRVSRGQALRYALLQLRILGRTCRQAVSAILTGSWLGSDAQQQPKSDGSRMQEVPNSFVSP